jgi:heme-degrading monooxygenase HmoA
MVVIVFRAKIVPGVEQELVALTERMGELVSEMPGFVSYKDFAAEDGENVTIVELSSMEAVQGKRYKHGAIILSTS